MSNKLRIRKVPKEKAKKKPHDESRLGFGNYFTDHMFSMNYSKETGWSNPRIEPYHSLMLDPAAMVLHYGQEVFEGMKAYRWKDGSIHLFRAKDNLRRLNRSAIRMCIPEINVEEIYGYLKQLIIIDQKWVPKKEDTSLYIRPNIIAIDSHLGVRASEKYLFYIILSPVGPYYPEGFNPISIYVAKDFVRAVRGGTGEAKTMGNYAASIYAQMEAKKMGYSQVLWLDAIERRYVEEVGTMNIFFVIENKVFTAPLTGTILPGITRDCVITICKSWGIEVVERALGIDEIIEMVGSGKLKEVFGSGTAAVIAPVGVIYYDGKDYKIGDGNTGELSKKIYQYLTGIQYGKIQDPYGWTDKVI